MNNEKMKAILTFTELMTWDIRHKREPVQHPTTFDVEMVNIRFEFDACRHPAMGYTVSFFTVANDGNLIKWSATTDRCTITMDESQQVLHVDCGQGWADEPEHLMLRPMSSRQSSIAH